MLLQSVDLECVFVPNIISDVTVEVSCSCMLPDIVIDFFLK